MISVVTPHEPPVQRRRQAPHAILGVGLCIESWARSCSGEDAAVVAAAAPLWSLQCEFPAVPWGLMARPPDDALVIQERHWRLGPIDLYRWDRAVIELADGPRWLVVQADEGSVTLGDTAREILTRYQRFVPRTNDASRSDAFRAALAKHRALHDLSLPLVRADYDHALDVWQWILRLSPAASLPLQLAGLFHDIERLSSEAERRIEHTAPDYQAFKDAHAGAGAALAAEVLAASGVSRAVSDRVASLIVEHERPHQPERLADPELALLADADALSFFSLNSPGFADYYGPEHTQKKVRYSLGRMTPDAAARLARVRLRDDIADLVRAAGHAGAASGGRAVSA